MYVKLRGKEYSLYLCEGGLKNFGVNLNMYQCKNTAPAVNYMYVKLRGKELKFLSMRRRTKKMFEKGLKLWYNKLIFF